MGTSSRNVLVNWVYGRRNGYRGLDAHGGVVYFGGFFMASTHDEPLSYQYSDHRTMGLTGGNSRNLVLTNRRSPACSHTSGT